MHNATRSNRYIFPVEEHVFVDAVDGHDRHAPLPLPHPALGVLVAEKGADHPILRIAGKFAVVQDLDRSIERVY